MNLGLRCTIFATLFATAAWTAPTPIVSLDDSFAAALKRSETISIQDELFIQAEERYVQARGAILPTITGFAFHLRQEQPTSAVGTSISPSGQTAARINATQPIFRGFREFAALRQQNKLVDVQRADRDRAALTLYNDVTASFYQVLALETDLRNFATEIEVNQKRQEEIKQLTRVGRSRANEQLTIEANIASLQAQIAMTRGQLAAAREVYAFLTGLSAQTALQEPKDATIPKELEPVQKFLSSVSNRPDLKSFQRIVEAVEESIAVARGAHLPSIDLTGNYWFTRPGVLEGVHWDAQIALSLPIFNGGAIQSQVRQAHSSLRQNELALQQARRRADQEVKALHETVQADLAQLKQLSRAVDLSQKSYVQQLSDYRLGLVTNVEVLQVLNAAALAKRANDRSKLQLRADLIRLDSASGRKKIPLPEPSEKD